MKKRSWFLIAAIGLLANLVGVAPSHANSITYTSTVVLNQDIPFTAPLTLPRFNTGFGALTAVTLTVNGTTIGDVQIYNNSPGPLPFTNAFTSVPVSVIGPGGTTATATVTATQASGTAAPMVVTSFPGLTGTATASASVLPANFFMYSGVGNFNATLGSTALFASSGGNGGGGKLFFGGTAQAGGSISVTYTFTVSAIPEPASMSLLGIGMAGFFAFRRFFNKRNTEV